MENDIDAMIDFADYLAQEVSLFYEEQRNPVGRMYSGAGSVLDVFDDRRLEEESYLKHFDYWRYEIVFDVVTECGDSRCRECAHLIDAHIVIAAEWRGVFKYEVSPGFNPVRVSTFIPEHVVAW